MRLIPTALADVFVVEPKVFGDDRGFFMETWNERTLAGLGLTPRFVQDNHSRSARGVLRGMHYQLAQPQGKLVRVVAGRAFDVAVDIRRASPNFGRWVGVELNASNKHMLWVPVGFAHGFLSLEDGTEVIYKCTDFYAPAHERSLRWDDPAVGIAWPLSGTGAPQLAAKDMAGRLLADADVFP